MTPRFPSAQTLFANVYRHARKPSRKTIGTAAATVAAAAGLAAGMSASHPAAGSLDTAAALNRAGVARTVDHQHSGSAPSGHATAHAAAAHKASHTASRKAASTHAAKPARHAAPAQPYRIYDSVTPSAISGKAVVATYATGNYAVSRAQVHASKVLRIDTNGSAPTAASILDVEPGDATPAGAAAWAKARLTANPHVLARIYTMRSEWAAVKAAIGTLPAHMQSQIRYWIADPTGVPHVVPGSAATQWYWGSSYDITTATPRF